MPYAKDRQIRGGGQSKYDPDYFVVKVRRKLQTESIWPVKRLPSRLMTAPRKSVIVDISSSMIDETAKIVVMMTLHSVQLRKVSRLTGVI
ncbi:hypothetical protein MnTg03_01299 [bacterium MnTg03]|nr:hypothetical protein MnTg03_01299 [bacterium MnTg03]